VALSLEDISTKLEFEFFSQFSTFDKEDSWNLVQLGRGSSDVVSQCDDDDDDFEQEGDAEREDDEVDAEASIRVSVTLGTDRLSLMFSLFSF
jgi:hypothetical protein